MQKTKNIRLLITLGLLISGVVFLALTNNEKNSLGVNKKLFQLDPQREINQVTLQGPAETNRFDFQDGRWHLNDSLYLDQSMRDVFFSVVSQLEIRRPVLQSKADSIANLLKNEGVLTTISFGGEQIQQYWVSGNSRQQVSWVMGEDEVPYEVHIPGYQSYVAGIFNVPSADWRSRFLLDVNFALLKTIKVIYPEKQVDLTLEFENDFFTIPGVEADSLKVANYLESLSFLQANSFVESGNSQNRVGAPGQKLISRLELTLINGKTAEIAFYSDVDDKQMLLAHLADGTLAKVSKRVAANLFKSPADFE